MSERKLTEQEKFWQRHYATTTYLADNGQPLPWLDLSNERVQAQHFALALEAVGPAYGRRCLDAGCGWGYMTRCLQALGGSAMGIDLDSKKILELQQAYPNMQWIHGSILDLALVRSIGHFDIIMALEILQYVDVEVALENLWSNLDVNGRVVGIVPNASCPIVKRVISRFNGQYRAVTGQKIANILEHLPSMKSWAIRGLTFRKDQQLWPYQVSKWTNTCDWPEQPNRLMFVAHKI